MNAGAAMVIAMQYPIRTDTATTFTDEFYELSLPLASLPLPRRSRMPWCRDEGRSKTTKTQWNGSRRWSSRECKMIMVFRFDALRRSQGIVRQGALGRCGQESEGGSGAESGIRRGVAARKGAAGQGRGHDRAAWIRRAAKSSMPWHRPVRSPEGVSSNERNNPPGTTIASGRNRIQGGKPAVCAIWIESACPGRTLSLQAVRGDSVRDPQLSWRMPPRICRRCRRGCRSRRWRQRSATCTPRQGGSFEASSSRMA